ncbi:Mobile element protein, partial [Lysinibacillus sphaericus OT4b.31]
DIAKSLGTDNKAILKWVKQFEHNGVDAFIKRCTTYTQEFKIDVLNFMTEYGTSLNETAAIFNIPAPSTITVWKKQLETHGIDALQSKKKGRPTMKKEVGKKTKQAPGSVEALEERIKQLEMENEYLKKLKALVQNKEKSPNKTKRK